MWHLRVRSVDEGAAKADFEFRSGRRTFHVIHQKDGERAADWRLIDVVKFCDCQGSHAVLYDSKILLEVDAVASQLLLTHSTSFPFGKQFWLQPEENHWLVSFYQFCGTRWKVAKQFTSFRKLIYRKTVEFGGSIHSFLGVPLELLREMSLIEETRLSNSYKLRFNELCYNFLLAKHHHTAVFSLWWCNLRCLH